MNLPRDLGKETGLRILSESLIKNINLEVFRASVGSEAQALDSWSLPPLPFKSLLERTNPCSLGIFFGKKEWGEPSDLQTQVTEILKDHQNIELQGPSMTAVNLSFYPIVNNVVEKGPRNVFHIKKPIARSQPVSTGFNPLPPVTPEPVALESFPELLLIPALACDLEGKRIGRGGGFYDRYITQRPVLGKPFVKCAVIHSQFFFEDLPQKLFHAGDRKVDFILTDKDLFEVNGVLE